MPVYGQLMCSAQNFPPKELYFCPSGETHHFPPKAAQTDLSGQNLPATFSFVPATINFTPSLNQFAIVVSPTLFTSLEINMTSTLSDGDTRLLIVHQLAVNQNLRHLRI